MSNEASSLSGIFDPLKEAASTFSEKPNGRPNTENGFKGNTGNGYFSNNDNIANKLHFFPASESKIERLTRIKSARNPVLEAASVLLRVLADIPNRLTRVEMDFFHQLVVDEIQTFTKLCEDANIRHDHKLAVRYALCSAIDEAAGERHYGADDTQNEKIGSWSTQALLQYFHQEGYGGKTVFLIVGRLAEDAKEHMPVLEVFLYIFLLGFKGMYRAEIDGERNLETIKNRIYALVSKHNGANPQTLSQHWLQSDQPLGRALRFIPLWLIASLLLLSLVASFVWLKYQISAQETNIRHQIEAIAKAPTAKKSLGLTELLENEITKKQLTVSETNTQATVQIMGDQMFTSGGATLTPQTVTMIERVAQAMLDVPGTVQVLGHTDSTPPSRAMLKNFPTNQKLSEARAQQVAAIFLRNGIPGKRIQTSGMGDIAPIANNQTAEGRSKNRRVELIINY